MRDAGLISRIKRIYGSLADKLSKQVYLNRINYLITEDYSYVEKYVSLCHPGYPVWNRSDEPDPLKDVPQNATVVLWGTGRFAEKIVIYFKGDKRRILFCGNNSSADHFHQYPVIHKDKIRELDNVYVIPCTTKYYDEVKDEIIKQGISENRIIDVRKWFFCGTGDEYFYEDFLDFKEDEVFVDAGCCDLESSIDFYRKWSKIDRIIAFEPDKDNYRKCVSRYEQIKDYFPQTSIFPYGTWNESAELHFEATHDGSSRIGEGDTIIKTVAIDDIVGDLPVSYIKMDVEGAELKTLEGAKHAIIKNRPKIAVCIYHKPEDMLELPEYLMDLGLGYKLYIRCHSNAENEVVMYAV